MSWLAVPVGVALGAIVKSPLFWALVLIALMLWRLRRSLP